jgi:hypothetical protein
MMLPVDDLVQTAKERIAERDGVAVAEQAAVKFRAMLAMKRPRNLTEAQAILEAYIRDGDR